MDNKSREEISKIDVLANLTNISYPICAKINEKKLAYLSVMGYNIYIRYPKRINLK